MVRSALTGSQSDEFGLCLDSVRRDEGATLSPFESSCFGGLELMAACPKALAACPPMSVGLMTRRLHDLLPAFHSGPCPLRRTLMLSFPDRAA